MLVTSYGLEEPNHEVAALISHATQERLKNLVEKLAVVAEHRIDFIKVNLIKYLLFLFLFSECILMNVFFLFIRLILDMK